MRSLADQNALWTADKSEFVRPPELYAKQPYYGTRVRATERADAAMAALLAEENSAREASEAASDASSAAAAASRASCDQPGEKPAGSMIPGPVGCAIATELFM